MDLVDRLPDVAALLLGKWRDRLNAYDVGYLEKHLERGDWQHQDVQPVRSMLPAFARNMLDPLLVDDDAGC
jgi:hypothetical protein